MWHMLAVHEGVNVTVINVNFSLQIKAVHINVKFVCDQCQHKNTQKCNLKIHRKALHGVVKYRCAYCDYHISTVISVNIRLHIKVI